MQCEQWRVGVAVNLGVSGVVHLKDMPREDDKLRQAALTQHEGVEPRVERPQTPWRPFPGLGLLRLLPSAPLLTPISLTLNNRTRRSPPATAMTDTLVLGCHATSTTPAPASDAFFLPAVGFCSLALRMRWISMWVGGSGSRRSSAATNDAVDDRSFCIDGTPASMRRDAH